MTLLIGSVNGVERSVNMTVTVNELNKFINDRIQIKLFLTDHIDKLIDRIGCINSGIGSNYRRVDACPIHDIHR